MMKYLILTICSVLMSTACCAQRKQIGDARTILKSGKNIEQAEKLMTDLLKNKDNQENTRIYDIWLQAVEKQYLALNEQMYLKQKVVHICRSLYFSSIVPLLRHTLCDRRTGAII